MRFKSKQLEALRAKKHRTSATGLLTEEEERAIDERLFNQRMDDLVREELEVCAFIHKQREGDRLILYVLLGVFIVQVASLLVRILLGHTDNHYMQVYFSGLGRIFYGDIIGCAFGFGLAKITRAKRKAPPSDP